MFSALDKLEARLSKNKYLVGDQLTEADIRAFVTAVRFGKFAGMHQGIPVLICRSGLQDPLQVQSSINCRIISGNCEMDAHDLSDAWHVRHG